MTNLDDGVTPEDPTLLDEGVADDGPDPSGETEEAFEPEPEPEYDYLELDDDLASKYIRIKQEGEERAVTLKEAIDGYNSNAVATKRFQEAADLRQQAQDALRLQQALTTNPGMTVRILADHAGVSVEEFLGMTPQQQQRVADDYGTEEEPEYTDPLEQKIAYLEQQLEQQIQTQEQREADMRLMRSVNALKQQYGVDDEVTRSVVAKALELGVGPEMFPMIYESMAFQSQRQAAAQRTAAAEAEAKKRKSQAQRTSQIVSDGSGVAPSSQTVDAGSQPTNPRDAVLAAFEQLERRP